jgi:hypothetical protein
MVIIGTILFRLCVGNQQLNKGSLICMCAKKLKPFPSKISPRVTFNITRNFKGCTERYRNKSDKNK